MDTNPKMVPDIDFTNGVLSIKGRSIPEDAFLFYESLLKQIDKYVKNPCKSTKLIIDTDYINTSSSKVLMDIAKSLSKTPNFELEWHYEEDDDDIKELGEMFQDILKTKVKFFEKTL